MNSNARTAALVLVLLLGVGSLAVAIGAAGPGPWSLVAAPAWQVTPEALAGLDVDVEGGTRDRLHIQVRAADVDQLRARGLDIEVLVEDTQSTRPNVSNPEERGGGYHDPEGMTWSLRALADEYPDVVRVVEVGRSV